MSLVCLTHELEAQYQALTKPHTQMEVIYCTNDDQPSQHFSAPQILLLIMDYLYSYVLYAYMYHNVQSMKI